MYNVLRSAPPNVQLEGTSGTGIVPHSAPLGRYTFTPPSVATYTFPAPSTAIPSPPPPVDGTKIVDAPSEPSGRTGNVRTRPSAVSSTYSVFSSGDSATPLGRLNSLDSRCSVPAGSTRNTPWKSSSRACPGGRP